MRKGGDAVVMVARPGGKEGCRRISLAWPLSYCYLASLISDLCVYSLHTSFFLLLLHMHIERHVIQRQHLGWDPARTGRGGVREWGALRGGESKEGMSGYGQEGKAPDV